MDTINICMNTDWLITIQCQVQNSEPRLTQRLHQNMTFYPFGLMFGFIHEQ